MKYRWSINYSGRHVCTDISADMSADIAVYCRPSLDRYSTDTRSTYLPCMDRVSVEYRSRHRPISRSMCRPMYRSRPPIRYMIHFFKVNTRRKKFSYVDAIALFIPLTWFLCCSQFFPSSSKHSSNKLIILILPKPPHSKLILVLGSGFWVLGSGFWVPGALQW